MTSKSGKSNLKTELFVPMLTAALQIEQGLIYYGLELGYPSLNLILERATYRKRPDPAANFTKRYKD